MQWSQAAGILIEQIVIQGQQVYVVHGNVIVHIAGKLETHVDERGAIEAEPVHLVQHKDVVRHALPLQKGGHVGDELEEFLKSVSKRHQQCHLVYGRTVVMWLWLLLIGWLFLNHGYSFSATGKLGQRIGQRAHAVY